MVDYLNIGSSPAEEDCVQVGAQDYIRRSICKLYLGDSLIGGDMERHFVDCGKCVVLPSKCPKAVPYHARRGFWGFCSAPKPTRRLGDRLIQKYGGARAIDAMLWWINNHTTEERRLVQDSFEFIIFHEKLWKKS